MGCVKAVVFPLHGFEAWEIAIIMKRRILAILFGPESTLHFGSCALMVYRAIIPHGASEKGHHRTWKPMDSFEESLPLICPPACFLDPNYFLIGLVRRGSGFRV